MAGLTARHCYRIKSITTKLMMSVSTLQPSAQCSLGTHPPYHINRRRDILWFNAINGPWAVKYDSLCCQKFCMQSYGSNTRQSSRFTYMTESCVPLLLISKQLSHKIQWVFIIFLNALLYSTDQSQLYPRPLFVPHVTFQMFHQCVKC